MARTRTPRVTPDEARRIHRDALVIDTQQPPITSGALFTPRMKQALEDSMRKGMTARDEIAPRMAAMTAEEIIASPEARTQYLALWDRSGVTIACGTFSGTHRYTGAYERANELISRAYGIADALGGAVEIVRRADEIERVHREGKRGIVIDFQNTTPFGDDLDRVRHFYNLGLRMVQLTYNLRNLVGDGCTETGQGGLSYFGREMVRALNDARILVDVSHCSEQVGWDALKISTAPVIVSHSASKAVCYHDRGKTDELAKAVADRGGYFGVVVIPGFISDKAEVPLDAFVDHVEHLVDVCGIDHVGIGTDKMGPGPGTESLVEYPDSMPRHNPATFDWAGFRLKEHRLLGDHVLRGYENFGDWPNLTVALAKRGFNEEELRKLLGLNYLRVFRDVCG
ncbi:MAG TPA: dipeptidase [bacterium]|nr:dipeptidase [bacterium]